MRIEVDIDTNVLGICHSCIDERDFTLLALTIVPEKWSSGDRDQVMKLLSKILNTEHYDEDGITVLVEIDGKLEIDTFDTTFLLNMLSNK